MPFIPDLSILAAFTLAGFVLTITPGPDMTLFLSKTLSQGRSAGLAAMTGAYAGTVVHTLLAAFGISALLASSTTAFSILKFGGAVYLLWLAWDAIANGSSLTLKDTPVKPERNAQIFLKGIGINLLNPKVILFYVTFLPQFISANDPHAVGKLLFLGAWFIVYSLPLCVIMVFMADAISARLKQNPRVTRAIDWVFASVFAAFAVRILLEPNRG